MVDASPDFRDRVSAVASWDVMPYILNIRRSELSVDFRSKHRVSAQVRRDSVTLHRAQKTLGDKHPNYSLWSSARPTTMRIMASGKSISMPPTGTTSISENCGNTARATSFIEATPPLSLPATTAGERAWVLMPTVARWIRRRRGLTTARRLKEATRPGWWLSAGTYSTWAKWRVDASSTPAKWPLQSPIS